jgi:hypothetical protein
MPQTGRTRSVQAPAACSTVIMCWATLPFINGSCFGRVCILFSRIS